MKLEVQPMLKEEIPVVLDYFLNSPELKFKVLNAPPNPTLLKVVFKFLGFEEKV